MIFFFIAAMKVIPPLRINSKVFTDIIVNLKHIDVKSLSCVCQVPVNNFSPH